VRFTENRTYLRARYQIADNLVFNNDIYLIRHERAYKETYTYTFKPATNTVARSNYRDITGFQTQYGDHGYLTLDNQLWGRKNQLVAGFDLNRSRYDRNDNTVGGNFPGGTVVNAYNFNPGQFAQGGNFPSRPCTAQRRSGRIVLARPLSVDGPMGHQRWFARRSLSDPA